MIELIKLHHISLAVRNLETSKRFYSGILGLREIERPAFRFPGSWYALGDRQLHLIQEPSVEQESAARLSQSSHQKSAIPGSHIALEIVDVAAVRKQLLTQGIEFSEGGNQVLGMDQIFCPDPDGHVIELFSYITE